MAQSRRRDLQDLLATLCDNVYFQPKANVKLEYPAIVYERDPSQTRFADNVPYTIRKRYQVTVIDHDPDSGIPDQVAELPSCVHNRYFAADSLNHDVFLIYF